MKSASRFEDSGTVPAIPLYVQFQNYDARVKSTSRVEAINFLSIMLTFQSKSLMTNIKHNAVYCIPQK